MLRCPLWTRRSTAPTGSGSPRPTPESSTSLPGGLAVHPCCQSDWPVFVRTTHYELCAHEDAKAAKCDAPRTIRFRIGDLRWEDGIGLNRLACGARGLRATWINHATLTDATRVFWKVKACPGVRCSNWTRPYAAVWVPMPWRVTPASGASVRFPYGFTRQPVGGAESYRFCLGDGRPCASAPNSAPGSNLWVARVSVPSGASTGRNAGHSVGNDGNYQGLTRKWRAATCVQITGRQDRACVYNLRAWDVTFQ